MSEAPHPRPDDRRAHDCRALTCSGARAASRGFILAALGIAGAVHALAEPAGGEIAREADRRQTTSSQFYEGRIRVVDARGKVREKGWRFWRLGYGGDSKTLLQFTAPPEVAGVGLLTVAQRGREDEQWMWTPAIQRDRRIAPQEKATKFLGTDFTYEDLSERIVDDYDYTLKGEEACEGGTCWIVESAAHPGKKSQYSRTLLWFRKEDYALMKTDLYVGDAVRRRLVLSGHRPIQGIVTAHELVMSDLAKGGRTELTLTGVRYDLPVAEDFYSLRSLRETHAAPPERPPGR